MIALVTTTINVPEVLRIYRRYGPDVAFVIAGDLQTPHAEVEALCEELGDCRYLPPALQESLYPSLSEAIGWRKVMRRNIAILEAAKLGPEIILTIDDDNEPLGEDYFDQIERAFGPFSGNVASGEWFNLGEFAQDAYCYRGLPYSIEIENGPLSQNGPCRVGVVNGLIYGDPDINATERIELDPYVESYAAEAMKGIAVNPGQTWTAVNSQNTAYRAEFAPLMAVLPYVGRYDDIFGAYIAQTVLAATEYRVLFGQPFVKQDRNDQDVYRNLEDEIFGMRNTEKLIEALEGIPVNREASVLDNLSAVLTGLEESDLALPHDFFRQWLNAWERL